MADIHITDIESAINFWRNKTPSTGANALPVATAALAEVYAVMAFQREDEIDEAALPAAAWQAWLTWFESTPDTPCIAICSTSQGDDICKGVVAPSSRCSIGPKWGRPANAPPGGASPRRGRLGASTNMPNAPPKKRGQPRLGEAAGSSERNAA